MNDNLHSFIEPELEARIVALVLGEASAFEAGALEKLIAEQPELQAFKVRVAGVHGVVDLAHREVNAEEWQLSDERREVILSRYRKAAQNEVVEKRRERGAKRSQKNLIYACAACLIVTLILGGMLAPMGTVKSSALESPAVAVLSESASREAALARLDEELIAQSDKVQEHRKDLTVLVQQYGIPYFDDTTSNPLGASEQDMFRGARQRLATLQTNRDSMEEKLQEGIKEGMPSEEKQALASELKSTNGLIDKVEEMVDSRKSDTVDLSLKQHTYTQATETYEQSRAMLREMKLARVHAGVGMERTVSPEPAVDKAAISDALASLNEAIPMAGGSDEQKGSNGSVSGFPVTPATPNVDGVLRFVGKTYSEETSAGETDLYAFSQGADGEASEALPLTWTAGVSLGFDDDPTSFETEDLARPGEVLAETQSSLFERQSESASKSKNYDRWAPPASERLSLELPADDSIVWSGGTSLDDVPDGKVPRVEGFALSERGQEGDEMKIPAVGTLFRTRSERPKSGSIRGVLGGGERKSQSQKPAAPSASLSKVITANSSRPTSIPVPASEMPSPSMDFGDGDAFGDGWGGEENVEVKKVVTSNEEGLESGKRPKGSYAFWVDGENQKANIGRPDSSREFESVNGRIRGVDLDGFGDDSGGGGGGRSAYDSDDPFAEETKGRVEGKARLAQKEAIRRQASMLKADETLMEGRTAYANGDYETAVEKYKEAAAILPHGTATAARKKIINDHLSDGAIALTQEYRRTGKYKEARQLLNEVEKNDPGSVIGEKGLDYLDDPIRTNPSLTYDQTRAEMLMAVDRAWELVVPPSKGDEGGISENEEDPFGDFDEMTGLGVLSMPNGREGGLEKNLTGYLQSGNEGGQRINGRASHLSAGRDTLFADEVPLVELPEGLNGAVITHENMGERTITSKGNQIVFPEVNFHKTTVEEALEFVRLRTIELDNTTFDENKKGVNIVLEDAALLGRILPNMKLENVPLSIVLEKIAEAVGTSVEFEDFAIRLSKGDKREVFEGSDESDSDRKTHSKTNQIILPEIQIENASLAQALEFLRLRSKELDRMPMDNDGTKGVEIEVNDPEFKKEILEGRKIGQLRLKNVPLKVAIEEVARMTGCKVRLDGGKVVFFSDPAKQVVDLPEGFETLTSQKSDSTFSLNVSDVSFKLAEAALREGRWPDASKVRPEEFVNALDYGDTKPSQAEKVACAIEQGAHPFMPQRNLMRVAMSTASLGRNATTPLRLTLLLDQSGSMERADRAESVKRAFALLAAQLTANDEITLIGFGRTPRLLAERVKGNEAAKLAQIIANPLTEGGTNLEAALASGLQLAKQQFLAGAQNRIILLTDGAANLGDALPGNLAKHVAAMRQSNIAFDACGVGADGLNDEVLSALTKQGDGRYYFLDRPEDADAGFAKQIAGALRPSAKNVKVQILFNPERVSKFKLYGFEKHKLKKEDFRNDAVDAAEMAAEESGVALYHFEPLPEGRGDIGTVSVRFLDTASGQMVERTWGIPYEPEVSLFPEANPNLRLASVAGLFAEKLKGSIIGERVDLARLRQEAEALKSTFDHQPRFQSLKTMLQEAGQ